MNVFLMALAVCVGSVWVPSGTLPSGGVRALPWFVWVPCGLTLTPEPERRGGLRTTYKLTPNWPLHDIAITNMV